MGKWRGPGGPGSGLILCLRSSFAVTSYAVMVASFCLSCALAAHL
jgi:hypothetical protein